ncbi:MAG: hypothetical protein LHV68_09760 [Elusimicrobia bacterium]|nr:hypothetical protein [Candidatus Liberimonas magnetica]
MLSNKIKLISVCLLLLFVAINLNAEPSKKFGVVLGDPWLGLRYDIKDNIGTEIRYTLDPEIKVLYLRGDIKLYKRIFCGLEYGLISFDYEGISGTGYTLTPIFIGYKMPINKRISFLFDLGISYIKLSSDGDSLGGFEFPINAWIAINLF